MGIFETHDDMLKARARARQSTTQQNTRAHFADTKIDILYIERLIALCLIKPFERYTVHKNDDIIAREACHRRFVCLTETRVITFNFEVE